MPGRPQGWNADCGWPRRIFISNCAGAGRRWHAHHNGGTPHGGLQADHHGGVEGIMAACPSQCACKRACTLSKPSCRRNGRARSKGECSGIACHGDTGGSREIWGKFPGAIGQAVCCRKGDGTHTEGVIPTGLRPGHIAIAMGDTIVMPGKAKRGETGCIASPLGSVRASRSHGVHPRQAAMARTRAGTQHRQVQRHRMPWPQPAAGRFGEIPRCHRASGLLQGR